MSERPRFPVLIWGTEREQEKLQNCPQIPSEAVLATSSQGLQTPQCHSRCKNGPAQILIYALEAREPKCLEGEGEIVFVQF